MLPVTLLNKNDIILLILVTKIVYIIEFNI